MEGVLEIQKAPIERKADREVIEEEIPSADLVKAGDDEVKAGGGDGGHEKARTREEIIAGIEKGIEEQDRKYILEMPEEKIARRRYEAGISGDRAYSNIELAEALPLPSGEDDGYSEDKGEGAYLCKPYPRRNSFVPNPRDYSEQIINDLKRLRGGSSSAIEIYRYAAIWMLRRAGLTYDEIALAFRHPRQTLSDWYRDACKILGPAGPIDERGEINQAKEAIKKFEEITDKRHLAVWILKHCGMTNSAIGAMFQRNEKTIRRWRLGACKVPSMLNIRPYLHGRRKNRRAALGRILTSSGEYLPWRCVKCGPPHCDHPPRSCLK